MFGNSENVDYHIMFNPPQATLELLYCTTGCGSINVTLGTSMHSLTPCVIEQGFHTQTVCSYHNRLGLCYIITMIV